MYETIMILNLPLSNNHRDTFRQVAVHPVSYALRSQSDWLPRWWSLAQSLGSELFGRPEHVRTHEKLRARMQTS